MSWKGRSDLEKQMRRANDRLRALERSGETRSAAYQEALRQARLATGKANLDKPRFSVKDFGGDAAKMKKAMKTFAKSKTSTTRGIRAAVRKTINTIEQRHDTKLTKADAENIGKIWEAIRKGGGKYNASQDTTRQNIIVKHKDESPDVVADIFARIQEEEIPMDEWEEFFDEEIEALHAEPENDEEDDEEDEDKLPDLEDEDEDEE